MLRTQKAQNAFRHVCRLLNNRRKNKTSEHRAAQKYIKRCHNILFMMVVCNKKYLWWESKVWRKKHQN